MTVEQLQPAERDDATDSDELMDALDVFFHVNECPNHTDDERREAYQQARAAFFALITDEGVVDEFDAQANAPTSGSVN